jgi:hypothetical protein
MKIAGLLAGLCAVVLLANPSSSQNVFTPDQVKWGTSTAICRARRAAGGAGRRPESELWGFHDSPEDARWLTRSRHIGIQSAKM